MAQTEGIHAPSPDRHQAMPFFDELSSSHDAANGHKHSSSIDRYIGQQRIHIPRSPSPLLPEHDVRQPIFPLQHASRQKPRKWPLAFRFIKGAIHRKILVPISLHALFTTAVVYLDLSLPASIIPTLSIVVGLMLIFRNSTSYERYWGGRNGLQTICTAVRNLTRSFLVCGPCDRAGDREETVKTVKCLVSILYAVKNYLRGNWGVEDPAYEELLPDGLLGHESEGLGLPFELAFVVERYVRRGVVRGAFNAPQSAVLGSQLNVLLEAVGVMETIKLTPIPICSVIHQKQVLMLYCCVLSFSMVRELGWWSVPVCAIVGFTLYGIDGIGEELEDPFGVDKNDIRMDEVVEDVSREVAVMLEVFEKGHEVYYQDFDE